MVAFAEMATRKARPTALPNWWKVLTRPDAAPASAAVTPLIPAAVSGANARPWPAPMRTIGRATLLRYASPACSRLSQAIPASVTAIPAASNIALPNLRVSRGTAIATAKLTTVIGKNPSPACNGLKPSTPCRYCVVK